MSARPEHVQGLRRHAEAGLQEADHAAVPGVQAAGLPALPRPPPPAHARERAREVRRLLALRRRVPRRLHPRRRRGEHRREPRLGRRALRAHLRDQHGRCIFCGYCELACPFDAITLGNDFEISEYNRDDLIYTKDMLLAPPVKRVPVADRDLYDTPIPYYQEQLASVANFLVWVRLGRRRVRLPRERARRRQLPQPVLLGARADREPRLARRALPAARRRVRRGRPGARLRRRGDGDVPVRDRLPRRPHRRGAVGRRADLAGGRSRARRRRDPRRGDASSSG